MGLIVGVALDDAYDLLREWYKKRRASRPEKEQRVTKKQPPADRRLTWIGWIMILVSISLAVVTVLFVYTLNTQSDFNRCQAQWQQDFAASYSARVAAASQVSQAIDEIVRSVKDDDPTTFDKAVLNYLNVREEQERQRVSNPPPQPPQVVCGEPIR